MGGPSKSDNPKKHFKHPQYKVPSVYLPSLVSMQQRFPEKRPNILFGGFAANLDRLYRKNGFEKGQKNVITFVRLDLKNLCFYHKFKMAAASIWLVS